MRAARSASPRCLAENKRWVGGKSSLRVLSDIGHVLADPYAGLDCVLADVGLHLYNLQNKTERHTARKRHMNAYKSE
jgi:hypothetical protein